MAHITRHDYNVNTNVTDKTIDNSAMPWYNKYIKERERTKYNV